MQLVIRFILASALVFSLSSFSMYPDTLANPVRTASQGDAAMAITLAIYDEWEPGLQREVRQIAIDGVGHGQISTLSVGCNNHGYHA
jgi:hypothetical protein